MTVNTLLLLCLITLLFWVSGKKGLTVLFALFFNLVILFVTLLLFQWGFPLIPVTYVSSIIISAINLFYINGDSLASRTAFYSSIITLTLMLVPTYFVVIFFHLQGLPTEELMEMDMYSLNIGVSFIKLSIAIILMTVVGAVNDIAVSITSAMLEIKKQIPTISTKDWYASGLSVGKDVLGTTINTLVFAAIGSQLALLIWVMDLQYSLVDFMNSKLLVWEWIILLLSGIGITLTVPLTTKWMTRQKKVDNLS